MPETPQHPTIDHWFRSRLNAWVLVTFDDYMHRRYAGIKEPIFAHAPAVVVELGAGTGANLRYLSPGTKLVAFEPNARMQRLLRERAADLGVELEVHTAPAEDLDLASGSVDFVFCSLVLCSVDDPARVLAEVRRVLRPGGRFACVEHVHAPAGTGARLLQHALRVPWKWAAEGCDLCRDTGDTLRAAGFSHVDIQPFEMRTSALPVRHHIAAVCVN